MNHHKGKVDLAEEPGDEVLGLGRGLGQLWLIEAKVTLQNLQPQRVN